MQRRLVIENKEVYEESIYTPQHADKSSNTFNKFDGTDESDITVGVTDFISVHGKMALSSYVQVIRRHLEPLSDHSSSLPVDRKQPAFTN